MQQRKHFKIKQFRFFFEVKQCHFNTRHVKKQFTGKIQTIYQTLLRIISKNSKLLPKKILQIIVNKFQKKIKNAVGNILILKGQSISIK